MRTCVILLPGLSGRLLDRLAPASTPSWFTEALRRGRATIRPALPAVTMTVQATYTTGQSPQRHGVVANGFAGVHNPDLRAHFDMSSYPEYRGNISFWEQSTKLLTAPRLWQPKGRRTAMLFVQSSMGGAADVVVTPKPQHTPDDKTISMCWSEPAELYAKLRQQLGEFPLHHYWGPMAGIKSSEWIIAAARLVWDEQPCDLQWTYIPQLDYDLQRWGPDDPRCTASLSQVLGLLAPLVEKIHADGGRVLVIGEYGMTAVSRSAAPNVALRQAGLLRPAAGGEMDYEGSRAFAMCDHQVAHIYCKDEASAAEAEKALGALPEVARIYRGAARNEIGLDSDRAGELVVFAHPDAWFEYRWWSDWSQAPAFAWTVDIHRKPGYDPTELFFDPATRRVRADQPQLVKGSHGALPESESDWPLLVGAAPSAGKIDAAQVAAIV
jgi:predicted AlkP superfamily pyrophosphatase or phosphodiesterase